MCFHVFRKQGSKKTGRAQSVTEIETATVAMTVSIAIIRDCDYCMQRPLVQHNQSHRKGPIVIVSGD